MRLSIVAILAALSTSVLAQTSTSADAAEETHVHGEDGHDHGYEETPTGEAPATVTGCHLHDTTQFCVANDQEWEVTTALQDPATAPDHYDGCHFHDGEVLHCSNGDLDVELVLLESEEGHEETPTEEAPATVTGCHLHETTQFCVANDEEWEVTTALQDPAAAPDHYDGCHFHDGDVLHCSNGEIDVELVLLGSEGHAHEGDAHGADAEAATGAIDCHSHAGVEHCVDAEGNTVVGECARPERDYNIPLRIGLLFVIMVTSAIGVFGPIFVSRLSSVRLDSTIFVALRQFGTGVIISTAIVHLFTHAQIYFDNECLPRLEYEATAGAILIAGLFVTFLIELVAHRISHRGPLLSKRGATLGGDTTKSNITVTHEDDDDVEQLKRAEVNMSASMMEAGIIFHSILIGITLVVAGDSSFITLFIVILFHQMFEGIALGSRIAMMQVGLLRKLLMGLAFALITPIGMAIGIGVLSRFNGNDPATIIAIGTLNAFSAGILLWIGLVEMWSDEWWRGPLAGAGFLKTGVGLFSLVAGLALMSLLGKWA